jgi:AcrR family transcriptional regulator
LPKIGPEHRAARRGQFMDAARSLAAQTGYRSLTIDDVCAQAGLSKGAFYVHFESKQSLLMSMLEQEIVTVSELLDGLEAGSLPALERIRVFVATMVQRGQDPAEVQLRAELWSQVGTDELLRGRVAEEVRIRRVRLAEFATTGAVRGELVEVPANAFGAVLVALVDGLLLHHAVDPTGFRWENISKVVNILLDRLIADSPAEHSAVGGLTAF